MANPPSNIANDRFNINFMDPIRESDEENMSPEQVAVENDRLLAIAHRIFAEQGTATAWDISRIGKVPVIKAIEVLKKFHQQLILERLAKNELLIKKDKK